MFVDLRRGYICIDCDAIFDPTSNKNEYTEIRCPRCTSKVVIPLSKWIQVLDHIDLGTVKEEVCRATSVMSSES